ncbi:MAG: hypothetical protein H0V81_08035, partial [Solirubrobacterales bacterium]|nr:hypothetical protein [Solirubrobacterales bacterium]
MERISSLDAALAIGGQIAVGELVSSAVPGGRSPLALIGKALIDATPGPLIDVTVAVLESADKPVLRASLVANWLAAAALAAPIGDVRCVVLAAGALGGAASLRRPGGPVTAGLATT